jgi:flagellar protein FliL
MATAAATAAPEAAPKKKGKKKLILILLALVLVGAGAGAGLFFSGMIGGAKAEDHAAKDQPKLLPKGSKPAGEKAEGGSSSEGPKYESSYFQLEKEFTSNLRESAHLVQVGLAPPMTKRSPSG